MVLEMSYESLERMVNPTHDIKLFAGRSNTKLAQEIADYLGTTVGPMVIKNFADGEIYVQVKESVRGDDVFIIQPLCNPVNENLVELLIIIDAFRREHLLVESMRLFHTMVMLAKIEKHQVVKQSLQNLLLTY